MPQPDDTRHATDATRPPTDDAQDAVWKALSDPTRRRILDLLRETPRQTTELVESFPELSRFGVMKHLDVLRTCNLVIAERRGRRVLNRINPIPLRTIHERWVRRFEDLWADQLLRVRERAETDQLDDDHARDHE